jgi:hypothetical protein
LWLCASHAAWADTGFAQLFSDVCVASQANFEAVTRLMDGRPGWEELPREHQPLIARMKSWVVAAPPTPAELRYPQGVALGVTVAIGKPATGVPEADCAVLGGVGADELARALEALGFVAKGRGHWRPESEERIEVLLNSEPNSRTVSLHFLKY